MQPARLFAVAFAFSTALTVQASAPAMAQVAAQIVPAKQAETPVTWQEDSHSFGNIAKGKPVSREFAFKNTTKQPVQIVDAKSSCACVTTSFSKSVVAPGASGSIRLTYDAAAAGQFVKTVSVTTTNSPTPKILTLKGKVN